jgi:DNA-binding Lrp family transcriptional regulator
LVLKKKSWDDDINNRYVEKLKTSDQADKNVIPKVDKRDISIVGLLISGYDNKQISSELQIPLSTIQRRTRNILQRGLLQHSFRPNYKQLGLKRGMIHVYLEDGNMKSTAQRISAMEGITSVSIHIGNSDIVGDFVYQDSEQIVDILSTIKKLDGVDKAVWSEEVFVLPVNQQNVRLPFHRLIEGAA